MDEKKKVRKFLNMQEKRNIRLLISLIALVMATSGVYFLQRDKNHNIVNPVLFKVDNLKKIDAIVFQSAAGKINLNYENTGWKINGHFDADRQLITVLFATLEQAIPKRPVAVGQRDSVDALFDSTGITVSLFEGTALRKQFQSVGDDKSKATYFRTDKNSEPYLMTIPGYRVDVSQIFKLKENGWRDKRIFDFRWQNFKSLTATFPADAGSNFAIGMKSNFFTVMEMADADTSKVMNYLDDLSLLLANQIISPGVSSRLDSLAKTPPLYTVEILDIAKRSYRLSLFPLIKGEALVLGKTNDNDLVLFDREKISRVFRKKGWFKSRKPS